MVAAGGLLDAPDIVQGGQSRRHPHSERWPKVDAEDLGRLGGSPLATMADLVDSEALLRAPGCHAGDGVGPLGAEGSVGILVLRHGHAVLNEKESH